MTGRNKPCPCGSGKKFKACHGRPGQKVTSFQQSAPAENNVILERARHLHQLNQTDAALDLLASAPLTPDSCSLQVEILIGRNNEDDIELALNLVSQWQLLDSTDPMAFSRAVEIHLNRDDEAAARKSLAQLLERAPGVSRTLYYQALVEHRFGDLQKAMPFYEAAAELVQPLFPQSAVRVMAVMRAYETTSGSFPGSAARNHHLLLGAKNVTDLLRSSLQSWEEERKNSGREPGPSESRVIASGWHKLGLAGILGFIDPAENYQSLMNCLALNPDDDKAISNGLMSLNYDANSLAEQIAEAHRSAGHWYATHYPQRKRRFLNQRKADRTLRVAYLSSDFRRHPVAHFILPVLQQHNRQQVRPYVYYTSPVRDEFTALAEKSSHQFVHAWDFDNAALASRIEQDNIDILVDLNGATAGGRLPLLAARAAPVQMTWLGYPNSTGLNSVDYRIVDHITDPAPAADSLATETLLRLPGPFSVYDPIDSLPDVTPPPSLSSGRITFGSFNNLAKYNDNLLECWSELLRRTPQAVLLLKDPSFEMTAVKERMLVWLERHGIPRQRVELLGFMASREEQFNAYSLIDIHLDTFPYNGTTTSCECLLMGVPVIALAGSDHRSRVGASLLHSLGKSEWLARSKEDYLVKAQELALDPQGLTMVRQQLRQQMRASPLMDAAGFTAGLEQAYHQCWEHWCRQGGPVA